MFLNFNKVLLLSEGRQIFFGPTDKSVHYFSSSDLLGLNYNNDIKNPAEFILNISCGKVDNNNNNNNKLNVNYLETFYKNSDYFKTYCDTSSVTDNNNNNSNNNNNYKFASKWTQFQMLFVRGSTSIIRDKYLMFSFYLKNGFIGIFSGFVFWGKGIIITANNNNKPKH